MFLFAVLLFFGMGTSLFSDDLDHDDFFGEIRDKTIEVYLEENYSTASSEERDAVRKELVEKLNASQEQISYALLISGSLKVLREFHQNLTVTLLKLIIYSASTAFLNTKILMHMRNGTRPLGGGLAELFWGGLVGFMGYQIYTILRDSKVTATLFPIIDKTLCAMLEPVES